MKNQAAEPVISQRLFRDVSLEDPFFDSLKEGYANFSEWFVKKQNESAYVSFGDDGNLQAFLYLKKESGPIKDVDPPLDVQECIKVGTFKINGHGTKLGERFVKIITDTVLNNKLRMAYLTIYPKHEHLIKILERFGFTKKGKKKSEDVYVKDFGTVSGDRQKDYPVIDSKNCNKWLMGINPPYHSKLFPDSILKTESPLIIPDISSTNSIYKIYVGAYSGFKNVAVGDCIIIYRTTDHQGAAYYRSVATSLCQVVEIVKARDFPSEKAFIEYCQRHSVLDEGELRKRYAKKGGNPNYAVKLSYNLAFPKRPNLKSLIDNNIVNKKEYLGLCKLTDQAFVSVLKLGDVSEGFVIY